MARWFKFSTSEQGMLEKIVDDDVHTTEDYERYLDEAAKEDRPITIEVNGAAVTVNAMSGDEFQNEVMKTLERKVIGQQVLEKLKRGGEIHD